MCFHVDETLMKAAQLEGLAEQLAGAMPRPDAEQQRTALALYRLPAEGEWTARRPGTFTLSIEDGFEFGRLVNVAVFAAALGAR